MRNPRAETATIARGAVEDDEPLPIPYEREAELRRFASAMVKRRVRTHHIGAIRRKLKASADGHVAEAAAQVAGREGEHLSDGHYGEFHKAVRRAIAELDAEERLAEFEHHAEVVHEPGPYGPDSPNSYYADLAASTAARLGPDVPATLGARSSDVDMSTAAVEDRLAKHVQDVSSAIAKGGDYAKRCKAILGETWREEDLVQHRQRVEKELRAFTTGGGALASASGGQAEAFVSPFFLLGSWAPYRSPIRTFCDQCANFPIPPYGMEVYIAVFTSADKASLQTEGATVAETVPSTSFEGAKVETATGQLALSQQWADRMNTGGGQFDELIAQELGWRVDAEIGKYVINQALAGATVVTGQSAYSEANLWKDLATARESLSDTAGTRLRATTMLTTTDLYGFITRQVDKTTERPIWPPWYATAFPLASDTDNFKGPNWPKYARYMGTVMPGDLIWLTDDAIPTYGTTAFTQIIVSAPAVSMVVCEGEGVTTATPETFANELRVVLNFRKYIAAVTRHAAGTATIQGAAYPAAEK